MGRPKGSKNKKSNHKAGGDRKSKKFQTAKEEKAKRRHEYFLSRRHQNDPSSAKSPHPMEEAIFKISKELMAEVLDHPSMPKGKFVPNQGTVDFTSGNAWEVKYDEDDDDRSANGIGDYGIGASSDDDKSSASSTRYRQSYTPSQGTPLYNYLMEVQGKIIDDENCQQQKFIHPSKSPLASGLGKSPNPSNFYKDVVVRVWIPDAQFKGLHYKYKCPSCQSDSINTKHQGSWRPAIANGDIHWVFFFRCRCSNKACKNKTFSTISQDFLNDLPSCILDEFEYLFPPKGVGILTDMLRSLSIQTSNHILFGAWTNQVNNIIWQKYYRRSNQYYELLKDWLNKWPSVSDHTGLCPLHATCYDGAPIEPYSAFGASGYHNGILMTVGQARTLFEILEGGKRFCYNQNSFAAWHDDGLRADDTFKICKKVHVTTKGKQRVQAMSSVLTLLSKSGKIVGSTWKMGMSHEVNRSILQGIKAARNYVCAPELKMLQTDNPTGEERPFYEVFPSLHDGTDRSRSLPAIAVPKREIRVFETTAAADGFFYSIIELFTDSHDIHYGLDTEFEIPMPQELTVLSLSFPKYLGVSANLPTAIILHLYKMRGFPESLRRILQKKNMVPMGRQIGGDCSKLEEQYSITIERRVELGSLCKSDRPELTMKAGGLKLKSLMKEYLRSTYPMDKSNAQTTSYARTLTDEDIQYCALDALVSHMVGHLAMESLARKPLCAKGTHTLIDVGSRCTVTFRNRDIAKGTIEFVGTRGEQRRWNGRTIGRCDCLVLVENVMDESHSPNRRHESWPDDALTLKDLANINGPLKLVVGTKQIRVIDGEKEDRDLLPYTFLHKFVQHDKQYFQSLVDMATVHGVSNDDTKEEQEEKEESLDDREGDDGTEHARYQGLTRSQRDIFHQLHKLPLKKNCEATAFFYQMILAATWINNQEDYSNVVTALQSNHNVEDVAAHEFFNRGYWRQRVRRLTPTPENHAGNLEKVKRFVSSDNRFKEYRTVELMKWFEKFIENARQGMYYLPGDMDVYRVERIDKDGLKVYVTDWGTNLNETLHQKYADLVGPYSVGMKSADLLLVLRSFRFNVTIGIGRCGEPDFGTDRHDIIDKTQHWILHTFGILPWPTHKNLLDFLPPSDSTVVGLRPLRFDPNHVRYSETPATKLSNDHYYLSKKLGLAIAPLPVCTKDEFMLYNSELKTIFEQGRNPNINDWNAMACKFLQEAMSEQKQIYPKTVDHLKKYFTSWKHNQRIKLFGKQLNLASNPLMKTLREQSTTKSPTIQTQNLPKQVTHLSRPLEAMPNYVPPDGAPNQTKHVKLEMKQESRNTEDERTYEMLISLTKKELTRQNRRCAWYPYCQSRVWHCLGYKQSSCTFIGKMPQEVKEEYRKTMVEMEVKKKIKSENTKLKRRYKALRQAAKPNSAKAKRKDIPEVMEIIDNGDNNEQVCLPNMYYKLRNMCNIVGEYSMKDLATTGMCVSDQVVDGYISLIINGMHTYRGNNELAGVSSSILLYMRRQGWKGVRHLFAEEKRVHFVPAFFGHYACGHWAAIIIDMTCADDEDGTLVYVDSIPSMRTTNHTEVKKLFTNPGTPYANTKQVLMNSPGQAMYSNDCGMFMLGTFVRWAFRTPQDHLVPKEIQLQHGFTPAQYGIEMRKHVHKSLRDGRINFEDTILQCLLLVDNNK